MSFVDSKTVAERLYWALMGSFFTLLVVGERKWAWGILAILATFAGFEIWSRYRGRHTDSQIGKNG